MLEELAAEKKYTYRMVGGTKRALQLMILEYPFAFWQWGNNCADIPDQESADWEEIFEYLVKVSSPDFFLKISTSSACNRFLCCFDRDRDV